MDPLSGFSIFFGFLVVFIILLFIVVFPNSNYTEIDRFGRRYRRHLFYPGRFCPGCGLRVITNIPKCLSCKRDFSKNSEGTKTQYRGN
jgi:DNA-directed RNA polymerase subunit RPC12/RpoP